MSNDIRPDSHPQHQFDFSDLNIQRGGLIGRARELGQSIDNIKSEIGQRLGNLRKAEVETPTSYSTVVMYRDSSAHLQFVPDISTHHVTEKFMDKEGNIRSVFGSKDHELTNMPQGFLANAGRLLLKTLSNALKEWGDRLNAALTSRLQPNADLKKDASQGMTLDEMQNRYYSMPKRESIALESAQIAEDFTAWFQAEVAAGRIVEDEPQRAPMASKPVPQFGDEAVISDFMDVSEAEQHMQGVSGKTEPPLSAVDQEIHAWVNSLSDDEVKAFMKEEPKPASTPAAETASTQATVKTPSEKEIKLKAQIDSIKEAINKELDRKIAGAEKRHNQEIQNFNETAGFIAEAERDLTKAEGEQKMWKPGDLERLKGELAVTKRHMEVYKQEVEELKSYKKDPELGVGQFTDAAFDELVESLRARQKELDEVK